MTPFKRLDDKEIQEINEAQKELFDELFKLFDPPLPDGVPERLEKIVALGAIKQGDTVLDIGSGTGILIPIIHKYKPGKIYACDISRKMLNQLTKNYPYVEALLEDIRDLELPNCSVDVAFLNACYPNIADKLGAFTNISRMMKLGGRTLISHPLGKEFILSLKNGLPFPLDEFPDKSEAKELFMPFGFEVAYFVDEPELYIMVLKKTVQHKG